MTKEPTREARAADASIRASYDLVPYPGASESGTHPDHLATLARLHGVTSTPVHRCRVLELGCADGGNLIPMANSMPDSDFLGIDLSPRQIEAGKELVSMLGLTNIELREGSLLDVDDSFGDFDYILAHGVFSWVPAEAQEKIFEICQRNLAPRGIAYVSYNTFPGWHQQGMIREMLRYHTRGTEEPRRRLEMALELIDLLTEAAGNDASHRRLLESTRERFDKYRDPSSYFSHEYLEEHNAPLYFHQFIDRAHRHALQYLAEAGSQRPAVGDFPPRVAAKLESFADGRLELEQVLDFAVNRTFRRTLLCHQALPIEPEPDPRHLVTLHASSPVKPASGAPEPGASERFLTPQGRGFATAHPTAKAVFHLLADVWPAALPCEEIATRVRDHPDADADPAVVNDFLLSSFLAGVVKLHTLMPDCVSDITAKPRASPLARRQAARGAVVTNQHHRAVKLDDGIARLLLRHLDGGHDRATLLAVLEREALEGRLEIRQGAEPVPETSSLTPVLERLLDEHLRRMTDFALLVG